MFTTTSKWLAGAACGALLAAGCASQAMHRDGGAPVASYSGKGLDFGTTPSAAELAQYYLSLPGGRDLPPGQGTYAEGEKVYRAKCVACHGENLQGTKIGDKLIGGRGTLVGDNPKKAPVKTVESYWPYATTLFDYVKRAMPFNAPGSLSNDEAYAVAAYILGRANIVPPGEVINAHTLAAVRMPNRDGFITRDPRPDAP